MGADGTFADLAGIEMTDWRAAAANLPPVDSHSLAAVLLGTGESTRKEIPIGTEPRLMTLYGQPNQVSTIQGVIREDDEGRLWKLLIGQAEMSGWQGVHYPNASTNTCCFNHKHEHGPTGLEGPCPADDPCPKQGITDCASQKPICKYNI